jgi:hypothetical protein
MKAATKDPVVPALDSHAPAASVAPIDPENDIDARKTVAWLVIGLVFVVVTVGALSQWFVFAVMRQRTEKIDLVPARELHELRSAEDHFLRGQTPIGTAETRPIADIERSIEASTDGIIAEYVNQREDGR